MNLSIKVLQGEECVVSVTPDTSIIELKQKIEDKLKIPVEYQKIIYLGRALVDDYLISSYPKIKHGTKLTIVVKKPDPLKDVIYRCFRRFYNVEQSEKLSEQFMVDFNKKIQQFSLDDIERIASGILSQQE